tara:strand:+ start:655 stop:900 length:246 start_codon:yes stop_codon:yes gene_type:complete
MDFTVTISDVDMKALENDLIDVNDWIQKAVAGKISKCKGRMVSEWQKKLIADLTVTTIPADDDQIITTAIARPEYKNRAAR